MAISITGIWDESTKRAEKNRQKFWVQQDAVKKDRVKLYVDYKGQVDKFSLGLNILACGVI